MISDPKATDTFEKNEGRTKILVCPFWIASKRKWVSFKKVIINTEKEWIVYMKLKDS